MQSWHQKMHETSGIPQTKFAHVQRPVTVAVARKGGEFDRGKSKELIVVKVSR